jgi:hypothetical protein
VEKCQTCGDPAGQWDYDQFMYFCDRHVQQADFTVPLDAMADETRSPERTRALLLATAAHYDRESLGRYVRTIWVEFAQQQPNPKPSWLVPWEGLSESDKEVDRRIGEALYRMGRVAERNLPQKRSPKQET